LLKQALKGLVPEEILYGKKRGFDVPYKEWLRKDLFDFATSTFEAIEEESILDKKALISMLHQHKNGSGNFGPLLWKSLVLAHWLEIYKGKIRV
jgi:asparagine synthase (glutamine-hydrolysing)